MFVSGNIKFIMYKENFSLPQRLLRRGKARGGQWEGERDSFYWNTKQEPLRRREGKFDQACHKKFKGPEGGLGGS